MTWYVPFRINGKTEFANLAQALGDLGFSDRVEYFQGGWQDKELENIESHLKFEHEDDAVSFILRFGGDISTTPPKKKPYIDG